MTDHVRRVGVNTTLITGSRLAVKVVHYLTTFLLIDYLGPGGFGIFSVVDAYCAFFVIVANFGNWGLDTILVRYLSTEEEEAGRVLGNGVLLKLGAGLLAFLLAWLISGPYLSLSHRPLDPAAGRETLQLLFVIGAFPFLLSFASLFTVPFQVKLRMLPPLIVETVLSLLWSALVVVAVLLKGQIIHFVLINAVIAVPGTVAYFILAKRLLHLRLDFRISPALWRYALREVWPLVLTSGFIITYQRIDQLVIYPLLDERQLGLYATAVKIAELPGIIPSALMVSVYPLLAKRFVEDRHGSFVRTYDLAYKYLLAIILPVAWYGSVFARPGLELFCRLRGKTDYLPMHAPLAVLLWAEVFFFTGMVCYHALVAARKQRIDSLVVFIQAVLNLGLVIYAIPRWGILGAAVASLISYGSGAVVEFFIPATRDYVRGMIKNVRWPFVAGLIAIVPGWLCWRAGGQPAAWVAVWYGPIFLFLYGAVLWLARWFSAEDLRLLRRALGGGGQPSGEEDDR